MERRPAAIRRHDLARGPVHLLLRLPDRAALPVRELDHRHRHVHEPPDDEPRRSRRTPRKHIPFGRPRLRDLPPAALARGPRNRSQTLHHPDHPHEHRPDRSRSLLRRSAGSLARLPRQRGAACPARRDLPAERRLQPRIERLGIPQVLQFREDIARFHLRSPSLGRGSRTRNLRLHHRRGGPRHELAALWLQPRNQPPTGRSRRSGRIPQHVDAEQYDPQERAADPLVGGHRRTRGALPPEGTPGPLQRGRIRDLVHLQPVAPGSHDRPPGTRRQTPRIHPLPAPRHAAARRNAPGDRTQRQTQVPLHPPLLRVAFQLPPALSPGVRPLPPR